jgi:hypothetical protein
LPRRGSGGSMYTRKAHATRETLARGRAHDQPTTRKGWVGRGGVAEGLVLPWKSGNADGGKEPWFKAHAGSNTGAEIGAILQNSGSFRRCEVHAMWKRRENSNVVVEEPAGRQRAEWVVARRAMTVEAGYAHSAVSPPSSAPATFRERKHVVLSESRMRNVASAHMWRPASCARRMSVRTPHKFLGCEAHLSLALRNITMPRQDAGIVEKAIEHAGIARLTSRDPTERNRDFMWPSKSASR